MMSLTHSTCVVFVDLCREDGVLAPLELVMSRTMHDNASTSIAWLGTWHYRSKLSLSLSLSKIGNCIVAG